jgi:hypothetical protein
MALLEQKYASRAKMALIPANPAAMALITRLPARLFMTTVTVRVKDLPKRLVSRLYPTDALVQYESAKKVVPRRSVGRLDVSVAYRRTLSSVLT